LKEIEFIRLDGAVVTAQGFVLERMGEVELAEAKYKEALGIYERRLEDDPENEKIQSDIAFVHIFLENKGAALEEIQNSILNNPNSQQLKMAEEAIKNFDRKEFIDTY
jgi:tetratricopeptide (TPR) repeat protein